MGASDGLSLLAGTPIPQPHGGALELRAILPAQHEHEGLPEIAVNIYAGPAE